MTWGSGQKGKGNTRGTHIAKKERGMQSVGGVGGDLLEGRAQEEERRKVRKGGGEEKKNPHFPWGRQGGKKAVCLERAGMRRGQGLSKKTELQGPKSGTKT